MSDDWKGEHKISAKPKTLAERRSISLSAASIHAHHKRQKAGSNASRTGSPWAISINRRARRGILPGGQT